MKRENDFQKDLIKELKEMFPGSIILKNDPNYKQGIPDIVLLNEDGWALLEVKRNAKATHRPNQDYYVDKANKMQQYGSFIYPENKEEVCNGIQEAFASKRRRSCISRG
ncbi:MAG TPA: hypothetical protein DCW90_05255 [Lachnospiraceae bacterium]|nr:hypothetical protein [Lachnospiraceae bacterium]